MDQYPPLNTLSTLTVCTEAAAYYLNNSPQTLRHWSSKNLGPLQPIKIGRKLHWKVTDILKLLGGMS
jgi:hypothetical protein